MASSEVEIVSSSPFGCVLRDHNGRENRYGKKNNGHACIQQNLKVFVHSCFSASPENAADSIMAQSLENNKDKWAMAREAFEKESSRGVSSIVQKWRCFEAESMSLHSNNGHINSSSCSSRSNSGSTITDNLQFLDGQIRNSSISESVAEKSEAPSMAEESYMDSESDRIGPSGDSNSTEKERMRVADIIKKLKCGEGSNEQFVANFSLPKVRTSFDHYAPDIRDHESLPATPRVRGHRAFNESLMQFEHDRHQEVQRLGSIDHHAPDIRGHGAIPASPRVRGNRASNVVLTQLERNRQQEVQRLGELKAVSKFSHRGRLQAMLKVKIILHEKELKDSEQIHLLVSDRKKHSKGSSVMHLRERFDTGLEQNAVCSSPRREVINNAQDMHKFSSSTQLKEVSDTPNVKNPFTNHQRKEVVDHTPNMKNPSTSGQLKEVVDDPSTLSVDNASTPSMDNPFMPNVDNPPTSIKLKEVVDHNSSAVNPTTSTQHKEEIHPPEVSHPESPSKLVVDINLNSTYNNVEDDINHSINVVCPTSKSLKEIIHSWEKTHLRSLLKNQDISSEALEVEAWSTSDRVKIDISRHEVINPQQNALELQNTETSYKEVSPNLDGLWEDTAFDTKSLNSQKSVDSATSPGEWKDRNESEEKVDDEQSIVSLNELVEDNPVSKIDWEEQLDRGNAFETFPDWKSNLSQEPSEGEDDQSDQNIDEPSLDWIYDVCRPLSDWECLRQERYEEMLDPFNDNGDIKKLLERKNVSSFLCSAMRDKIDKLMVSRTQGQPLITDVQVEKVKQDGEVEEEGKYAHKENEQEGDVKCNLEGEKEDGEKYAHEENEQEGGVKCYPEGEDENESPEGRQHSDGDEYSNQTPSITSASADIFGPWSHDQDNNASPRLQQFLSPTMDNQQFSSLRSNHPSIEMELICDLRGHMEQLHKEIFDLRKSLHTCMEMQVKMQQFMMREAESVKRHSTQNKGNGSINRLQRKGTCCLCFDAEVDSLLYRCGHMCTCYKCAHDLQQHSGICPMCQAPILDVVNDISFSSENVGRTLFDILKMR
ncbi:hypothetical protein POM88_034112 [Heracleum sosnowskyi]|uniref:RING-type domain-containing protein n=1 Tax=Heracleum sosnowskyi TaxID=360622 RepID=A0AAD8HL24_9APIA|nr:hypothetical protein POM88_034112 [Heracleum sosnowskyi]